MTLLRVTDPESGKSWTVEAIDMNDPTCKEQFHRQMVLYGHVYLYSPAVRAHPMEPVG
jgi:hypothetical protein